MTEKQFQEIVARQQQTWHGVPSQIKTDIGDLISERMRVGGAFEPEPKTEEELAREAEEAEAKRTSGARKK